MFCIGFPTSSDVSRVSARLAPAPERSRAAPHPFYLSDEGERAGVMHYLRSLDTNSR